MENIGKDIICVSAGINDTEIEFELFSSDILRISTGYKNSDNESFPRVYAQIKISELKKIINFLNDFNLKFDER